MALKKRILSSIFIIVLLIIVAASAFHYVFSADGMTLVAQDVVLVYATANQAKTWPHPAAIAKLYPGQSVPVTQCVDVKSYMIHQIRLPDGRVGFVLDGKYLLMRNGKHTAC